MIILFSFMLAFSSINCLYRNKLFYQTLKVVNRWIKVVTLSKANSSQVLNPNALSHGAIGFWDYSHYHPWKEGYKARRETGDKPQV